MVEAAAALAHPGREPVDAELLRFVSGETDETTPSSRDAGGSLSQAIAELESRMLADALAAAGGNQSEAARTLGVSRVGLVKKMSRLGLR